MFLYLEKLLLRFLKSNVLTKLLRVLLKLDFALYLLSVLGSMVYLACFLVLDDDEVVLYF